MGTCLFVCLLLLPQNKALSQVPAVVRCPYLIRCSLLYSSLLRFSIYFQQNMDHNVHHPSIHSKNHDMRLWFHSSLGDNVLFEFWRVDGLALAVLAFLSEYTRFQLWIMEQRRFRQSVGGYSTFGVVAISPRKPSWIFGVVYAIQLTLSYVSMQIFMTYSIWLGLALCLGGTAGFCYFEHQRRVIQRTSLLK